MISAIQCGKCSIKITEDVKTSCFFDRLLLLPDDIIWDIIRRACYDNESLPHNVGILFRDATKFWPSWDAKNTTNNKRVEPDLFLCFEKIDLIIEAKQEYNLQKAGQWKNEYRAYCNESGGRQKKVIVIAIDGITNTEKEEVKLGKNKTFLVQKTRWRKLCETAKVELDKQDRMNGQQQTILILKQLKDSCDCLGITETIWPQDAFTEAFVNACRIHNFDVDIKAFSKLFFESPEPKDNEEEIENIGFANILNNKYTISDFSIGIKTLINMECKYE